LKFTGIDKSPSRCEPLKIHKGEAFIGNRDELDQKAEQDQEFIARLKKKIPSKIS